MLGFLPTSSLSDVLVVKHHIFGPRAAIDPTTALTNFIDESHDHQTCSAVGLGIVSFLCEVMSISFMAIEPMWKDHLQKQSPR